jgi:hypothetical protein
MRPQLSPAREPALAGNDELSVMERRGGRLETGLRVSPSQSSKRLRLLSSDPFQERARAFPLVFEVEAGHNSSFYACVR